MALEKKMCSLNGQQIEQQKITHGTWSTMPTEVRIVHPVPGLIYCSHTSKGPNHINNTHLSAVRTYFPNKNNFLFYCISMKTG